MKLTDFARADCARYREPAVDIDEAIEALEATLVKAWAEERTASDAVEAALASEEKIRELAAALEGDRAFRAEAEKSRLERERARKKRGVEATKAALATAAGRDVETKRAVLTETESASKDAESAERSAGDTLVRASEELQGAVAALRGQHVDLTTLRDELVPNTNTNTNTNANANANDEPDDRVKVVEPTEVIPPDRETTALAPYRPTGWGRVSAATRRLLARVIEVLHWRLW